MNEQSTGRRSTSRKLYVGGYIGHARHYQLLVPIQEAIERDQGPIYSPISCTDIYNHPPSGSNAQHMHIPGQGSSSLSSPPPGLPALLILLLLARQNAPGFDMSTCTSVSTSRRSCTTTGTNVGAGSLAGGICVRRRRRLSTPVAAVGLTTPRALPTSADLEERAALELTS